MPQLSWYYLTWIKLNEKFIAPAYSTQSLSFLNKPPFFPYKKHFLANKNFSSSVLIFRKSFQ